MTIVSITKARVIKSIREEPALKAGSWVDGFYTNIALFNHELDVIKNKHCSVCAVGSVMRHVLDDRTDNDTFHQAIRAATKFEHVQPSTSRTTKSLRQKARQLVSEKKYMNAISYLFEGLTGVYQDKTGYTTLLEASDLARKPIIKFIEKYFPNKIKIDINGARPAKDVKVVKAKGK